MLRGYFTLAIIAIAFSTADLVQRLVVAPLVRILPSRRERILTRWQHLLADLVLGVLRTAGGARIPIRGRGQIPSRPGVLVLMNHQSLVDIPVVFQCVDGGLARVVTRRRYARGIPLVSHMLRLYEHPLVDPGRMTRQQIATLREAASTSRHPFVLFPEGHRSRDGNIGPFRKAGLRAILSGRPWSVYLVVVDGLRPCARLKNFVRNVHAVRARVECLGPFPWPDPAADPDTFIEDMRTRMCMTIREMRDPAASPSP